MPSTVQLGILACRTMPSPLGDTAEEEVVFECRRHPWASVPLGAQVPGTKKDDGRTQKEGREVRWRISGQMAGQNPTTSSRLALAVPKGAHCRRRSLWRPLLVQYSEERDDTLEPRHVKKQLETTEYYLAASMVDRYSLVPPAALEVLARNLFALGLRHWVRSIVLWGDIGRGLGKQNAETPAHLPAVYAMSPHWAAAGKAEARAPHRTDRGS